MNTENLKTALLVMDVQPNILSRIPNADEFLPKIKAMVNTAHEKGIPVVYIVVGFRSGMPEVSERNKSFGSMRTQDAATSFVDPQPAITPVEGDVVVTKRRVSAFTGSDLEVILRAKNIQHLILTGISTSGVVLSTIREAADKDYKLTILSDLCADGDAEVHEVLMTKVFPRQADVMTSQEWESKQ